jgi:hypothetical protein
MKIYITAKAKASPAKQKNTKTLKRYWNLIYGPEMVEKMTVNVNER